MAPGPQPPLGILTSYTTSPNLPQHFTIPLSQAFISHFSTGKITVKQHMVASALVFSSSTPPKILIVQRAAKDYAGNLWEIPGGSCDAHESILDGAVRELWEESGLVAKKVVRQVGGIEEWLDRGEVWKKISFEVEVEDGIEVRLDEEEHQAFFWVSEEECRAGVVVRDGKRVEIKWTWVSTLETILEGFRLRKEGRDEEKEGGDRVDI